MGASNELEGKQMVKIIGIVGPFDAPEQSARIIHLGSRRDTGVVAEEAKAHYVMEHSID